MINALVMVNPTMTFYKNNTKSMVLIQYVSFFRVPPVITELSSKSFLGYKTNHKAWRGKSMRTNLSQYATLTVSVFSFFKSLETKENDQMRQKLNNFSDRNPLY